MTRFDPEKNRKTPQEWSETAFRHTADNGNQWKIIIGIMASVFGAGATTPLVGGIIFIYTLWHCWQKAGEIQRAQKAIIERGCVANVLEGDDFYDYLQQAGHDAVIAELRHAQSRNLLLSNDALDYLDEHQETAPAIALHGIDNSYETPEETEPIRRIKPTATALKDRPRIDIYKPEDEAQIDIIGQMTDRITNTIIIGTPGSGKGILIDNARRAAQLKHDDLKVFLIDPKADPKERGYHQGVDVVKAYPCVDAKPASVAAWAEAAFDEYVLFAARYPRSLLIIDEGTMLGNKLKEAKSSILRDKLTSWTSGGDSFGRNVWFVAQSPYVAGNINLATISQMTKIVIAFGENLGSLLDWKKSGLFAKVSLDVIGELIEFSPVARAVFFGKTAKWYAMPKLENKTGYDRDRREYTELPKEEKPAPIIEDRKPEIIEDTEPIEEVARQEIELSEEAFLVLEWLKEKRPGQWVKFKGKDDRDMTFINFLSDNDIKAEERESIIDKLILNENIELSPDGSSLKIV